MKLHNRNSFLASAPERAPKRRRTPRITQLLYFIFLFSIVGYIIYLFATRALTFHVQGLVEADKIELKALYGGTVLSLPVKAGERIDKGEVLAVIGPAKTCSPTDDTQEISRTTNRIQEAKLELTLLEKEFVIQQDQKEYLSSKQNNLRRALELNAPLVEAIENIDWQIAKKQAEIEVKKAEISILEGRLKQIVGQPAPPLSPACLTEEIKAPYGGRVALIPLQSRDHARAGETIAVIVPDNARVSVEVFDAGELYPSIEREDTLTVEFPDQTTSEAKLRSIRSPAEDFIERKHESYQAVLPGIKIYLEPVHDADVELWKTFDRYQVTVKGVK